MTNAIASIMNNIISHSYLALDSRIIGHQSSGNHQSSGSSHQQGMSISQSIVNCQWAFSWVIEQQLPLLGRNSFFNLTATIVEEDSSIPSTRFNTWCDGCDDWGNDSRLTPYCTLHLLDTNNSRLVHYQMIGWKIDHCCALYQNRFIFSCSKVGFCCSSPNLHFLRICSPNGHLLFSSFLMKKRSMTRITSYFQKYNRYKNDAHAI